MLVIDDIEKALLGSILLDAETLLSVIQSIDPDDFYQTTHQKIYRAIIEQRNSNEPVDFLSVYNRLSNLPFDIFSQLYASALPTSVEYLARLIRDASNRRIAVAILKESMDVLNQPTTDLEAQVEALSSDLVSLIAKNGAAELISAGLVQTLRNIEDKANRTTMLCGLSALDDIAGGMHPGDCWVIAGRTSMGKSSLAETICLNVARAGNVAAYVSLEGNSENLRCRLLSIDSGVWMRRIKSGKLRDIDYPLITDSAARLGQLPIYTYDGEYRWEKIKANIEMLKLKDQRLAVVFIDYLGLARAAGFRERWAEIAYISAEFKRLCVSLNIVGVMLCQINRQTEGRKDHRPTLGDLRDSGAVEQDADVALLLYRPSYYQEDDDETLAQISIAKNRDGATGNVELEFDAPCVRFRDRVVRDDWRDVTEPQRSE